MSLNGKVKSAGIGEGGLSRTPLRTAPERSRVPPVAFVRLRMAVSDRLRRRPIQARAISQTAFEDVAQALIPSRTRARGLRHMVRLTMLLDREVNGL